MNKLLGTLISHAWGIFSFWEEVRAGCAAVTARVSWWQVGVFARVLGLGSPLSPRCTWHVFIVMCIPQSIYCQLQPGHRCEMLAVGLCGGLQGWQTLGGAGAPQRSLCCCSLPSVLEGHPNPLMYLVPAFCTCSPANTEQVPTKAALCMLWAHFPVQTFFPPLAAAEMDMSALCQLWFLSLFILFLYS